MKIREVILFFCCNISGTKKRKMFNNSILFRVNIATLTLRYQKFCRIECIALLSLGRDIHR